MNILLLANYLPDKQQSMQRYAGLLERELRAHGHTVTTVSPPERLGKLIGRWSSLGKWVAYVDKYILARGYLRDKMSRADLVHICDHSNSMYIPLAGKTPSVITLHDLLAVWAGEGRFPGVTVGATGRLQQRWIARHLRRAKAVICVTRKTQADLLEMTGSAAPANTVVHHSLNWDFHPVPADDGLAALDRRGVKLRDGYFLHVGSNNWYKNRVGVVSIFAELKRSERYRESSLILAGRPWSAELRSAVLASGVAEDIYEVNNLANEDLRALYCGAIALLFPSREEGFGWPVIEAQACGCPVITTDRPPMTEVAGGAAILIDPEDPQAAAQTILAQAGRFAELRTAGFENIKLFTTDRAIDGYLAAYQAAIEAQTVEDSG